VDDGKYLKRWREGNGQRERGEKEYARALVNEIDAKIGDTDRK
jgi:hypothetical protein